MIVISSERVGQITDDPQDYFGISRSDDLFADVVASYASSFQIEDLKFISDNERLAIFNVEDEEGCYLLMIAEFTPEED